MKPVLMTRTSTGRKQTQWNGRNEEVERHCLKSRITTSWQKINDSELQSEVAKNDDHVRGLQHQIKELRIRLSNVQNNYQDLKFEAAARKDLDAPSKVTFTGTR